MWEEWQAINSNSRQQPADMLNRFSPKWAAPSQGQLKCNVDPSFRDVVTGLGCCLWDSNGSFVQAFTSWRGGSMTVLERKTEALLKAVGA
ncbi:hypothetical protein A2U01_0070681, partial [Trifolium medium]|nr:hypothetical protein [Trifolium medium]